MNLSSKKSSLSGNMMLKNLLQIIQVAKTGPGAQAAVEDQKNCIGHGMMIIETSITSMIKRDPGRGSINTKARILKRDLHIENVTVVRPERLVQRHHIQAVNVGKDQDRKSLMRAEMYHKLAILLNESVLLRESYF